MLALVQSDVPPGRRLLRVVLEGGQVAGGLEPDPARLGVEILQLEEHHLLLALRLSAQLLHLHVDEAVDLLKE